MIGPGRWEERSQSWPGEWREMLVRWVHRKCYGEPVPLVLAFFSSIQ